MREFLKSIHDYPDEATGVILAIVFVIYLFLMYKLYKK